MTFTEKALWEIAEDAESLLYEHIASDRDPRRYGRLAENLRALSAASFFDRCEKGARGWHSFWPGMDAHASICRYCHKEEP